MKAYTAGYNLAMRLLETLVKGWSESTDLHGDCTCQFCRKLREIVPKTSMEPMPVQKETGNLKKLMDDELGMQVFSFLPDKDT